MVKIFNGDCFVVLDEIEDVDYIFTSPPYNRKRNDKYELYDDNIEDYYQFLVDFTDKALSKTKKHLFMNIQTNYYNKSEVYRYIGHYADKIKQIIIWEKSNPLPANGHNITNAYEYFIVLGDKSLKSNETYTKNCITTSVNTEHNPIHKAVMKQEVADWFIKMFTSEGDTVCDPFMGLGTTGISCIKYNRNFIGIELNEVYFETAKNKIDEYKLNTIGIPTEE